MFFFGLHVEHVIVCIENLSPWRMRAAKFTETLNAEDDTMPKKILDCSSATLPSLPSLLRISFGLKVCFLATDRLVYPTFWAVLLVLPHSGLWSASWSLPASQTTKAVDGKHVAVHTCLMYSHVFPPLDQGHTSWSLCILDAEKSIQLLNVKS